MIVQCIPCFWRHERESYVNAMMRWRRSLLGSEILWVWWCSIFLRYRPVNDDANHLISHGLESIVWIGKLVPSIRGKLLIVMLANILMVGIPLPHPHRRQMSFNPYFLLFCLIVCFHSKEMILSSPTPEFELWLALSSVFKKLTLGRD